jgi:predicted regulator of Ras-like GTPase activity (Roadblock/LC7/MglB family)
MNPDVIAALGPDDLARIETLLQTFVVEAGARSAFLVDRHGRAVAAGGDREGVDQTSFASLAAADFDASDQLARLLGEREFTSLYHQGVHGSMYIADVAGTVLLAAVFDRTTTLGMVRLETREVTPRIRAILTELEARGPEARRLDAGWGDEAVTEIDRLLAG